MLFHKMTLSLDDSEIPVQFLTISCLSFLSEGLTMSDEKRLIKHLLDNYERVGLVGRPVYNTSETVRVNYGLALIQILDLDEKNQVLTTNVWSRYVSTTYSIHSIVFTQYLVIVLKLNTTVTKGIVSSWIYCSDKLLLSKTYLNPI